jgi:hypothetical protein
VRDELSSDSIHGERIREGSEGARDKIRKARADTLGTARVHDQLKVVVVGEQMALGGFENRT